MFAFHTIRALLFDMDGVIYEGQTRLPGVIELMQFCDEQGIAYVCITNNASKTPDQFERKLHGMGIMMPSTHVISSALAAAHYIRTHYPRGTTAYVIGMKGLQEAIYSDGYILPQDHKPNLVVLGVDLKVDYDKFKIASLAIQSGATFIVTNTDQSFPTEEGMWPGAGALAAFLQTATGVEPLVIGKPNAAMFTTALDMLGVTNNQALMIGDRLETDIAGARAANIRSALVLTGATKQHHLATSTTQPDGVFDDLVHLLTTWQETMK